MIYLNNRPARADLRDDAHAAGEAALAALLAPVVLGVRVVSLVGSVVFAAIQLIPSPVRLLIMARRNHDLWPERGEFGVYLYRTGPARWLLGVGTAWGCGPFVMLRWTVPAPRQPTDPA